MGFIDKLKNIFFEEEEYEEIEDNFKVEKKEIKEKSPDEEKKDAEVLAKKVEIPKEVKEIKYEKKEIEKKSLNKEKEIKLNKINTELIFDDEDFIFDTKPKVEKKEEPDIKNKNLYRVKEKKEEIKEEKKYDLPKTTFNSNQKQNTKSWTPSPIISPIYGILDKNYKKEEVRENKEIRISSRPSRMDVDSIRNKAFGDLEYDLFENIKEDVSVNDEIDQKEKMEHYEKNKKEIEKSSESKEDVKPTIDNVTLGEADEYYNDLGLAYNTDYKDLSKDISDGKLLDDKKTKQNDKKDKLEDNLFDLIESMYDRED